MNGHSDPIVRYALDLRMKHGDVEGIVLFIMYCTEASRARNPCAESSRTRNGVLFMFLCIVRDFAVKISHLYITIRSENISVIQDSNETLFSICLRILGLWL